MTSLRKQFGTSLATSMLRDIQYQKSNYYYFLGKLEQWALDDRAPATIQSLSEYEDMQIRNNAACGCQLVQILCQEFEYVVTQHPVC